MPVLYNAADRSRATMPSMLCSTGWMSCHVLVLYGISSPCHFYTHIHAHHVESLFMHLQRHEECHSDLLACLFLSMLTCCSSNVCLHSTNKKNIQGAPFQKLQVCFSCPPLPRRCGWRAPSPCARQNASRSRGFHPSEPE